MCLPLLQGDNFKLIVEDTGTNESRIFAQVDLFGSVIADVGLSIVLIIT